MSNLLADKSLGIVAGFNLWCCDIVKDQYSDQYIDTR